MDTPQTKERHPVRRRVENFGAKLGFAIIPVLPRPVVNRLAYVAGAIIYLSAKRMRRIGLANLDTVFGDEKTLAEKKRILKTSIAHFVRSTLDLFWFSRNTEARCKKHLTFDPSFERIFGEAPALVLTGHLGNWEVMGIATAIRLPTLMSVAAPLKNPTVDKLFIEVRECTGQTIIPQQGAIRQILKGLKSHGKMAVLLDQNTRLRDGGIWIDFCGRQVPVSPAPAAMALKAAVPIQVVYCLPDKHGHYTAYMPEIIPHDPTLSPEELTQCMSDAFLKAIKKHPECWLWIYKRFKYLPPGTERSEYPWYSKTAV